jgi:hypothetical protein
MEHDKELNYNDSSENYGNKGKNIEESTNSDENENKIPNEIPRFSFPKKINPGPGFNVPGGAVPIHDDICKYIEYNGYVLRQFRNMDLDTALEQRNNYIRYLQLLHQKTLYAQNVLSTIPETPTTDYEVKLKNQILRDLERINNEKLKAEARATLITSRIEYIGIHKNNND